jgi:1-acyl-sn-glycerol-3-phosphate acyltransferase
MFLKYVALGPFLKVVFRPRTSGKKNVPASGPVILASNHLSYADWLFLALEMPRMVRFVAKAEYFTGTGIKGALSRFFFTSTGNIPIDRSGANAAEGALISAKGVLAEGALFGIYPEGTRSHDGRLYKGKVGVAKLAIESGAPVVPVGVIGTDIIAPNGKKFGKVHRPTLNFGEPMDFSAYKGKENDREVLRQITDQIMDEIHKLCGQEYVKDTYAADAKKAAQARRDAA